MNLSKAKNQPRRPQHRTNNKHHSVILHSTTMASFYGGGEGDYLQAVVADVGQAYTKVGWAGNDAPKAYFRSVRRCEKTVAVKLAHPVACLSTCPQAFLINASLLHYSLTYSLDTISAFIPQNVAVLREEKGDRSRITDVRYDYYHRPIQADGTDGAWQITNPVHSPTGLWLDPNPAQADWYDLIPKFVEHAYQASLNSTADRHPLLMVEPAYNPPPIRQHVVECLFEQCNVPAAFLSKEAVLSCYATGRTTATVVDFGYSGTTVAPVTDGYVEPVGIQRSSVGVRHMDAMILEQLDTLYNNNNNSSSSPSNTGAVKPLYVVRHQKRAPPFYHAARLQIAADCREAGAGAAVNTTTSTTLAVPHKPYTLPDGTTVHVASGPRFAAAHLVLGKPLVASDTAAVPDESQRAREKYKTERTEELNKLLLEQIAAYDKADTEDAAELYSAAAAVGLAKRRRKKATLHPPRLHAALVPTLTTLRDEQLTAAPVAQMVCDAAYRCDREVQASLLGTVILAGGGSCLGPTEAAVPEFVKDQLEATIHQHTPGWRVKVLAPEQRAQLPWIGGSILASLGAFHEMWITAAEYEEWGPAIVNRKCP